MLQGSLQTVALAEVLQFLESTSKTGQLHVTGAGGEGRLWFDGGLLSGFDTRSSREPAEAVFELMALDDGDFVFDATDAARPTDSSKVARREVGPLLVEAKALCEEWSAILGVVPSLERRVELAATAPSDPVTLGSDHWAAIVAVGSGRTVREVIARRDVSDIAGCRVIRDLVEAGLASICEATVPSTLGAGAQPFSEMATSGSPQIPEALATSPYQLPAIEESAERHGANGHSANGHIGLAEEPPRSDDESHDAASVPSAGILGFDFGSLIAEFPVAAVTEPESNGSDEEEFSIGHYAPGLGLGVSDDASPSQLSDDDSTPSESSAEDRYAALRAAMLEVGENLEHSDDASWDGQADDKRSYEVDAGGVDAPQAGMPFHALLNEVSALLGDVEASETANQDTTVGEPGGVDALADRGPWSEQELADIHEQGMWEDLDASRSPRGGEGDPQSDAFASGSPAGSEEAADDFDSSAEEPVEEPINRGLLLKFLSSVRN